MQSTDRSEETPATDVEKSAERFHMCDSAGDDVARAKAHQMVLQTVSLRRAAGQKRNRFSVPLGKRHDFDRHGFSHAGNHRDVLSAFSRAAENRFLGQNDSAHTPQIDLQAHLTVADRCHALHGFSRFHGAFQSASRSEQIAVLLCVQQFSFWLESGFHCLEPPVFFVPVYSRVLRNIPHLSREH